MDDRSDKSTLWILFLTVATGFSGLAYEVVWHRYLTNLVGSQARASAIILALFLGGLSAGYAVFGKLSKDSSPRRLIWVTGIIECIIGIWALLFPFLYNACYTFFVEERRLQLPVLLEEILLSALLLFLPTFLMGGTLPLLTQALSKSVQNSSKLHATLYALNTGGAFLGCISAGLYFVPALGLPPTLTIMSLLNIIPGIFFIVLARQFGDNAHETVTEEEEEKEKRSLRFEGSMKLLSFLAGFVSLALQVLLMRLVAISIGGSEYAFTVVVSIYILFLALGSWRLRHEQDSPSKLYTNQITVIFGFLLLYGTAITWPYVFYRVRILFPHTETGFYLYLLTVCLLFSILLAVPVAGMGRTMPLVFSRCRDTFSALGSVVGRLYMWNTLGCMLGAIGGGYLLLFVLDLDHIIRLLIVLLGVTALLSLTTQTTRSRMQYVLCLSLILCGAFLPDWPEEYLAMSLYRKQTPVSAKDYAPFKPLYAKRNTRRLLFYEDGPNTSIGVIESAGRDPKHPVLSIWVNGKSDGATAGGDLITTRVLGHIPLLFARDPSRVALIGFGTGITAGAVSLHPGVKDFDLIEISSAMRHTTKFFADSNHNVTAFPQLHWITADAYRTLTSASDKYGVIISGPSNPWIAGIERLYADEFYALAGEKLVTDGVFAQWMHLYAMSEKTLSMVFKTFRRNFKSVWAFRTSDDLILIGSQQPLSFKRLALNWEKLPGYTRRDFLEIGLTSPELMYPYLFALPAGLAEAGEIHSLMYPKLAYAAGKDFFMADGIDPLELFNSQYSERSALIEAHAKYLSELKSVAGEKSIAPILKHRIAALCGNKELLEMEFCESLVRMSAEEGPTHTSAQNQS